MIRFDDHLNEEFFNYWVKLPKDGMIPDRSAFLPEDVPEILPYITVYELKSKSDIRIRLSGDALNERDGHNRKGRNYLDYVAPERVEKASEALWSLAKHPCAMRVKLRYKSESGLVKEIESIGVPMQCDETGQLYLYYCSREINLDSHKYNPEHDELQFITVTQRDFIDIGAGIPSFQD